MQVRWEDLEVSGAAGWLCHWNVKSRMFVWGFLWQVSSHPPGGVSVTRFTGIASQLPPHRAPVWGRESLCVGSVGSNAWSVAPFSVPDPTTPWLPMKLEILSPEKLLVCPAFCSHGSLGPKRASHLPRDTQLLSKDPNPGLNSNLPLNPSE